MSKQAADFIFDMSEVVQRHYSDGRMPASDLVIYLGLIISSAASYLPEKDRYRVAQFVAQEIRRPSPKLHGFIAPGDNTAESGD